MIYYGVKDKEELRNLFMSWFLDGRMKVDEAIEKLAEFAKDYNKEKKYYLWWQGQKAIADPVDNKQAFFNTCVVMEKSGRSLYEKDMEVCKFNFWALENALKDFIKCEPEKYKNKIYKKIETRKNRMA